MAKSTLNYCGNCGRRIQKHQSQLEIAVRRGTQFFHETWEGCFESTRESGKVRMTEIERNLQLITPIY